MTGIVIVTHGLLAETLIGTVELITGSRPDAVTAVSIMPNEDADRLREKIIKGIKAVNRKKGILIFTDMFGGTPSNLSYSLLEEGQVEVLSGVNLPILLRAVEERDKKTLDQLAVSLESFGKRSISLASGILRGNRRG
ncbi:MAG: PTS fructose transporter subunit IIA [Desulfobacterales bacterium]